MEEGRRKETHVVSEGQEPGHTECWRMAKNFGI
jgi:hypothetical protein